MSAPGKCRTRKAEIKRRHKRREKICKLRSRYEKAKTESERGLILAKLFKIAPAYLVRDFTRKP